MGAKAEFVHDVTDFLVVISFVQTHALRLLLRWLWTLEDEALDGRAHQLPLMALRPVLIPYLLSYRLLF